MKPFSYQRPVSLNAALELLGGEGAQVVAGGTTKVDLMRRGLEAPGLLVDVRDLPELRGFEVTSTHLRIGALTTMQQAIAHPQTALLAPAVAESLHQGASTQIRNVATIGGNLLQRTRCQYFRSRLEPCHKLSPGSGCAALRDGSDGGLAVLGASAACAAIYAGDLAVALAALEAEVELVSLRGRRTIALTELHVEPGDQPEVESSLAPDELVAAVLVPRTPLVAASTYAKLRDRRSFAYADASAAVALRVADDRVEELRVAVGGTATRPWRSHAAELAGVGALARPELAEQVASAAYAEARGSSLKKERGRRAVAAAFLRLLPRVDRLSL